MTARDRPGIDNSQYGLKSGDCLDASVHKTRAGRCQCMGVHGRLRTTSPGSFGIRHIAPALPEFLVGYPYLSVDMTLADRRVGLVEEGFDMAIRISELADSSLVARRLGPCRHFACGAPGYFKRHGVPCSPSGGLGLPLVILVMGKL